MNPDPLRTRRAGFTLLEVLAAVALLGVLYTVLAGVAITWLGREGEARRRLEASLRADNELAALEAQIALGAVPAPGTIEEEDERFKVVIDVQVLSFPVELIERPGFERAPGAPTLFPQREGAETPLRRIDVVVSWADGFGERSVLRSTVALDLEAAQSALAAIPPPGQPQ